MKLITITFLLSLFISCGHELPIAKIEFDKIEKTEVEDYYKLYFHSDIELVKLIGEDFNSPMIKCFLDKKKTIIKDDFVNNTAIYFKSVSDFKQLSKLDSGYIYSAETFFSNPKDNSNKGLTTKDYDNLKQLINKLGCVQCVVTAVTYLNTKSRYISESMCIPKEKLLEVIP
ncbi:hypothetical protein [Aquimarina agarilytica]|uniref:hypothetical protein n=1 Tax=Aquimarina agarilytica TaxID=1087449 RepID=UPI000289968D|nr:hypothetical protein [Aquimarina agarilytica]